MGRELVRLGQGPAGTPPGDRPGLALHGEPGPATPVGVGQGRATQPLLGVALSIRLGRCFMLLLLHICMCVVSC